MIYSDKRDATEDAFVSLLEKSKILLIAKLKIRNDVSSFEFEKLVYEEMCRASIGTEFEDTIKLVGKRAFPDITANRYFGVEVKCTTQDHWTSIGNSIMESSRLEGVERIYIIFGKLGGNPQVKYRLYQECLPEVRVTHSPRYGIDMNLPSGESIFDKMGVDYDTLRSVDDLIKQIKNHYRRQLNEGEELWWVDENKGASLVIRVLSSFSDAERDQFFIDAMILFPEIFGKSTRKFERVAAYLLTEYNAVSANLRDKFSAGGKVNVKINGLNIRIPKIFSHLYKRAKDIQKRLGEISEETLSHYWRVEEIETNRVDQWKKLINERASVGDQLDCLASDVHEAGLDYEPQNKKLL